MVVPYTLIICNAPLMAEVYDLTSFLQVVGFLPLSLSPISFSVCRSTPSVRADPPTFWDSLRSSPT